MTTTIALPTQPYLDGAKDVNQPARYKFIADLLWDAESVLDVGCGDGILSGFVTYASGTRATYFGIDADPVAVNKANASKRNECFEFACADAEVWTPDRKFDAVVLNEFLYYTSNPAATLQKWCAFVKHGGLLVISIYNRPAPFWQRNPNKKALKIARQFAKQFPHKEHTVEQNGKKWSVLVLHC